MADECRLPANRTPTREHELANTCDLLVHDANVATMIEGGAAYGAIENGLVAVRGGRIAWVGAARDAPAEVVADPAESLEAGGGWVTPGLIDAHTHLVFAGNRARELEQRLAGASYEDIARSGGGIVATVAKTRAATSEALFEASLGRILELAAHGVTTVEIKSGYGLDVEHELRMLAVARRLGDATGLSVSTTLLGAHALPPEHVADREGYLNLVCEEMIPRASAAGLADAVDAFCEGIAFTAEECGRVLEIGARHGLAGRLHADQRSDLGGAELAARRGARSADHLEHTSERGVRAMADAGTTAVLLPGAYYFLRDTHLPPVAKLREHGVPIAIATDLNPGSSPLSSPLLAMNMACLLFGLTPEETLVGMTRAAAPVLGMAHDRGVLRTGARADLALWAVDHPAELSYWLGANPCTAVVRGGGVVRSDGLWPATA